MEQMHSYAIEFVEKYRTIDSFRSNILNKHNKYYLVNKYDYRE